MNSGKILLGILTGISIGATLGILFAPDKGSSTRKKVSEKGDKYTEDLEEKFNEFVYSITQKLKNGAARMSGDGHLQAEEGEAK